MAWIQCLIETTPDRAEFCSECLMNTDAVAVTFEDAKDTPLFEPAPNTTPLWSHTRVIGLFENTVDLDEIKNYLKQHLEAKEFSSIKVTTLADQDWVKMTNQTTQLHFGNNFWIIPSSTNADLNSDNTAYSKIMADPNATYVILDAGLAFGTGTHPTTALCLKWLAAHPPKNQIVLDYGCGSGILGIAAKKLGAKEIYAVDHDPQALTSTKVNAEKNSIALDSLHPLLPKQLPKDLKVDLIMANILLEPLLNLAENFAGWLNSDGQILLSGILSHQVSDLTAVYEKWFKDFTIETEEEWVSISAKVHGKHQK